MPVRKPRKPPPQELRPSKVEDEDQIFPAKVSATYAPQPPPYVDQDTFLKPVVTRGPNVAELIAEYHETGKVMPTHLADLLKAIAVLHEAFGEDMPSAFRSGKSVPIPDEVVGYIIAALTRKWELDEYNAEKAKKANDLVTRRDALMEQHRISKREAARRIIKQGYPGLDEISPKFKKPWETLRKK
jgi:hypothetical protein